jgi:hypothetical protein
MLTDNGGGRKISELIPFIDKLAIGKIDEVINTKTTIMISDIFLIFSSNFIIINAI